MTDSFVVEGGFCDIKCVAVVHEIGSQTKVGASYVGSDFGKGKGFCDVEGAGLKGAFFGILVFDGVEVDFFKADDIMVPVMGIFFDYYFFIEVPAFEGEGAVGDEVAGAGPAGAALIDFSVF